jgi:hypothetical protein
VPTPDIVAAPLLTAADRPGMASEICATAAGVEPHAAGAGQPQPGRQRGLQRRRGVGDEITALVSRAARMSLPHTGASVAAAHTGSPVSAWARSA